jgi:hypothetical protein
MQETDNVQPDNPVPTPPKRPETPAARRLDERIKSAGDAATALFKALFLILGVVVIGVVAAVTIWRDVQNRILVVDVGTDAEKTLRALGASIDLRLALLDALNQRVAGVRQIVAVQGLAFAAGGTEPDSVSFKPFGLELSTDDITHIVDLVMDRPVHPSVRLELLCAPVACTDTAARQATLLVNLSGPNGTRTAAYPVLLGNRGLVRSLHQAIETIADLVLEQNEPLIASVLFLNRPTTAQVFPDQYLPDLVRAEGAAIAGRSGGNAGCLADLVIGGSLVDRGELAAGIAAERRAGESSNLVCRIHADTNTIFLLSPFARCSPSAAMRHFARDAVMKARSRLVALGERRGEVADQIYFRIPAAFVAADLVPIMEEAGATGSIAACIGPPARPSAPAGITAARLLALLRNTQALPPDARTVMQHGVLHLLWEAMQAGVPRGDAAGHLMFGRALMDAIRAAEVNDPHPRALFMLEGRLAMDLARTAFAALDRRPPDPAEQDRLAQLLESDDVAAQSRPAMLLADAVDRNFSAAAVAFENAYATSTEAPLVEPVSDVEALGRLGDSWYAAGGTALARAAYALSIARFIETNEPVEQVIAAADNLAHWGSLLIDLGACGPDAPHADANWTAAWTQMGAPAPDVCRLGKPDNDAATTPLAGLRGLIGQAMAQCFTLAPADSGGNPFAPYRRRLDMLDCYARRATDPSARMALSAQAINDELARALRAPPPPDARP